SHDLRAPLRPLHGFSEALLDDYGDRLDDTAKDYLRRIQTAAVRMAALIDDLLQLSRSSRGDFHSRPVDLVAVAGSIVDDLRRDDPGRAVEYRSAPAARVVGDARLLRIALENLLRNAWKFTRKRSPAHIELGVRADADRVVYFVRDDGAGFDAAYAHKLFE